MVFLVVISECFSQQIPWGRGLLLPTSQRIKVWGLTCPQEANIPKVAAESHAIGPTFIIFLTVAMAASFPGSLCSILSNGQSLQCRKLSSGPYLFQFTNIELSSLNLYDSSGLGRVPESIHKILHIVVVC